MILEGKSLVIKGKLKQLKKKQIEAMLRHTGALFKTNISYTTDLLVVGETKSDKERQKAKESHAEVMTEAEFIEFFQLSATTDERWQRLRDFLGQATDREGQDRLCQHLSLWPDEDDLELAIDYVSNHLKQNRTQPLATPPQWVRELMAGEEQPRLKVAPAANFCTDYNKPKIAPQAIDATAHCPSLRLLSEMSFRKTELSDVLLKKLCDSPHLPASVSLDLSSNPLSSDCLSILAASPMAASLRELNIGALSEQGDKPLDLGIIADSGAFPNLQKLVMTSCSVSEEGIAALAASEQLPSLEELRMKFAGVTDDGMRALAQSQTLGGLKVLELSAVRPSVEAFAACMQAPFLQGLTALHLGINDLTDEHIEQLANASLPKLKVLDLHINEVTAKGCQLLFAKETGPELEELNLYGNKILDAGIEAIASSPRTSQLRKLNIRTTDFTEAGIESIAQSPSMARLEWLDLTSYTISPEWALAIYRSPYLSEEMRTRWSWALPATKQTKGPEQLLALAKKGEYELLQTLISEGAKPSEIEDWGNTEATEILKKGHQRCLEQLFDNGMSVDLKDYWGNSFLLAGMLEPGPSTTRDEWAAAMLTRGADVNLANDKGLTPLHIAACLGEIACVERLLEAGASLDAIAVANVGTSQGHVQFSGTPLHAAAYSHHEHSPQIITRLLEAGADPTIFNKDGQTPLQAVWRQPEKWKSRTRWMDYEGHWPAVEAFLETLGEDCLETPDHKGMTLIFFAIRSRRPEQVKALLERGANPNLQLPRTKKSPLQEAIEMYEHEPISLLLEAKADPNMANSKGETPLWQAVYNMQLIPVETLLENGADPNLANKAGVSPLMVAAISALHHNHESMNERHAQIWSALITHDADPDAAVTKDVKLISFELKSGDTPRQKKPDYLD